MVVAECNFLASFLLETKESLAKMVRSLGLSAFDFLKDIPAENIVFHSLTDLSNNQFLIFNFHGLE